MLNRGPVQPPLGEHVHRMNQDLRAGLGALATLLLGMGFQNLDRGSAEDPVWYVAHSGGNWGYRAYLVWHRDEGYGYAAMVNGDDFDLILEIQRRLAGLYGWEGDFTKSPRNLPSDG